jgi:hypothetical protein
LQTVLGLELYQAIPNAAAPGERHLLLQIRRDIHSDRMIPEGKMQVLSCTLRGHVSDYNSLLETRMTFFETRRRRVFEEVRSQINTLLQDAEFCRAVDYSCPWLIGAYRRHGPGDERDFSKEERGIYSYAVRFFSKANPFHIFAKVAFPPGLGLEVRDQCEIVVDIEWVLQLEQQLLGHVHDSNKYRIYLNSFFTTEDAFHFLVRRDRSLHQISVNRNQASELLIEMFQDSRRDFTLGECVHLIASASPTTERATITKQLKYLAEKGILKLYLVSDVDHFEHDLIGIHSAFDDRIRSLQAMHLAHIPMRSFGWLDKKRAEAIPDRSGPRPLYYVNTYSRESTAPYERLAEHFYADLSSLKHLFSLCSGFYQRSYVYSQFILNQCIARPQGAVPYVELVTEFVRNHSSLLAQFRPPAHGSREEQQERKAWLQRLAACVGTLSDQQLAELTAGLPGTNASCQSLCFNGPADPESRVFYPHNIFPGSGRYIARYIPDQTGLRGKLVTPEPGRLDVQIVPSYEFDRCYVAAILPVGCGFDGRYRHKFTRWIDPTHIIVKDSEGSLAYFDRRDGQRLRFHYFGFLQGQFLPPEYQLLLTSHSDFFYNPFLRRSFPGCTRVQHVPALYYRSICLRREQWAFCRDIFEPAWRHKDILRCTAELLALIREEGLDLRDCYFEIIVAGRARSKPRYVDLDNPLSVHAFRRAVRSSPASTIVSFTRVEPPPSHFLKQGDLPLLAELMIEV